jgi:serine phosphatase RsbU (regulator of sigma subunit)/ABC-type antimicrobial peptide transport system permease subunit
MLLLALRNLRARPARTLFTALAIALGVGMIFAMRLVSATVDDTARQARLSRLAGADLEVTSGVGAKIPLSLLAPLDARPEVELAAPLYRGLEGQLSGEAAFSMAGAQLQGTGLALLGVDPARTLTPYELVAGEDLRGFGNHAGLVVWLPNDWAALHGFNVGSTITLATGEHTDEYVVVGLVRPKSDAPLPQTTPTAWLPLSTLNAAFGTPDTATSILIRLKPGLNAEEARDDLQTALGDQYLVASAGGGQGVGSIYDLISLALPVAGFAVLLTGGFLVFNAFAITLAERRREIGQLRTLGMTRGQILTQVLIEAGLIGLLGSALGLILGWGLGRGVVAIIAVLQGNSALIETPLPLDAAPLAVGAGMLVTLGVTVGLAAQAARTSPLLALQTETATAEANRKKGDRKGRPYGLILGIGLLIGTAAAYGVAGSYARTATTPNYGWIFLPVLTFGAAVMCLLPTSVNGVLALAARLFKGATARLALGNLRRGRTRAALTAATLVISFMLVIALTGVTLFMSTFLISFNASMFSGRIALVRPFPPGTSLVETSSLPTLPPIPSELQAEIDALGDEALITYFANVSLPGVGVDAAGTGDRYAFAMPVRLIRDKRTFPLAEGSWDEVERAFRENEPAIFLPEPTGRKLNKHPGDRIELDTLEGKVSFYVAGVGGAFPVISPESAAHYFGSHPFGIIFDEKPGVDRARLEERVEALVDGNRSELSKLDTQQLASVVDQLVGPLQGLFAGLTSLSGLVAALGIVVTLVASVLERQRELGTLRALGMSRAQVRGLVVLEAGFIGFAGAALGALGGLGMAWLFAQSMNTASVAMLSVQAVEAPVYPWPLALASVFIGPAAAMLAALYPADRAANVNPAEAMRAEGATGFLKPAAHLGPTGLRGLAARMPLAAKLSLGIGLVFVATVAALTLIRANYERQLLEDNISNMLGRLTDTAMDSNREQLPAEVAALTPQVLLAMQQQAGAQAEALQAQFRQGGSEYDFTLEYLFIADPDLKVIYSDKPEFVGRTLTETIPLNSSSAVVRITDWTGERVFEAVAPIENRAGKRVGIFQAGLSTAPIDNFIRQVLEGSLGVTAAALALAIGLTVFFTRRALAPVAQIAQASNAVARGDLTQRIPESHWDEVGSLARSFNDMVRGLNERERLQQEMRLAHDIQQTLLPKELPALPGWQLAAHYQPAREVGADFYDYVYLPGGRLGLVIGDVSGKGAPAALVMSATRSLVRACALDGAAPSHVLARVNDLLQPDIPPKMFVTCLYAILDPASGRLQYANAGHDLPYRRSVQGVEELRARGMPLGLLPGMGYEEKETALAPGERVLFYSDGLVEAHNPQREMFGFPRLGALMADPAERTGGGLIEVVLAELRRFTGAAWEQEDDVTLVMLQRTLEGRAD